MVCPFTAGKGSGVSEVLCACGAVKSCGGRGGGGSGCGSGLVAVGAGVAVGARVAVGVDRGGRRRGIAGGRGGVFVVRPSTHACQPGNEQALVGSPVAALIKPSPTSTS